MSVMASGYINILHGNSELYNHVKAAWPFMTSSWKSESITSSFYYKNQS